MSNTIGTTNAVVIAQKALEKLLALLPILKNIAVDHSAENAKFNETIIVHEVAAAEAEDFVAATGYVPSARAQVDIPVTINKHKHHTYSVGVTESSISRVDLIERFALTSAYSIGAAVVNSLFELITEANFANKTVKALGAGKDGFDYKTLSLVGESLDDRHVAPFGRFCLLNSAYYGSLTRDTSLLTILLASGADAVRSGLLPEVNGFGISKYTSLPGNNENLVGIAGTRTALALATRIPDDPGVGQSNVSISTVTEPQSGLSLQVREWYNSDLAQFRRTYTLMYGVAKGQPECLQRIVSANAPA